MGGHSVSMRSTSALPALGAEPASGTASEATPCPLDAQLDVVEVYERHFDFVWRTARRLGVESAQVDDVVQEVFMVVHRRAGEFEGRASLKTWLFGITRRVVANHFRTARRKPAEPYGENEPRDARGLDAESELATAEGNRVLHALLDELDADKREVFVLAELEEMTGPELAQALGLNLNTAYARLRAARAAFEQALVRHRARARRTP
jgi:RNA polymerase sigma-70 factor (ECF subfamily)